MSTGSLSSISPALGLGGIELSRSPSSGGGGAPANPNLLLWTEALDNPAWTKTSVTVAADYGDATQPTADQITFSPGGSVRQITTTASLVGAAVTGSVSCGPAWARRSISGIFDGLDYTFSCKTIDRSGGGAPDVRLRMDRSGGFLRASIEDVGDEAICGIVELQLEQAVGATTYQAREGT